MKQLIPTPASAIGWLQSNPTAIRAHCFAITLPTGETLYATDGQWDLTIPAALSPTGSGAVTFLANQYGVWSRGPITSEADYAPNSNTMDLSFIPKMGAMYPGLGIGLLNAAINHLFDGAQVWVWAAYMPQGEYGNVQVVETKYFGYITAMPQCGRLLVKFDVADAFFLLNMKVPVRLFQSACPWQFADENCGLAPNDYTYNIITASGSTSGLLIPNATVPKADGYFTQGVAKCLIGANAGLSATIKAHTSGQMQLIVPFLLPVAAGDEFALIKGCDKTPATCAATTSTSGATTPNWKLRFGGTPFLPTPQSTI